LCWDRVRRAGRGGTDLEGCGAVRLAIETRAYQFCAGIGYRGQGEAVQPEGEAVLIGKGVAQSDWQLGPGLTVFVQG
jgi:hypothetical protein